MPATATRFLTVGQVAAHFGVAPWKVGRLFERGFLPIPEKVGVYRVVDAEALGKVEVALRAAGYLQEKGDSDAVSDSS